MLTASREIRCLFTSLAIAGLCVPAHAQTPGNSILAARATSAPAEPPPPPPSLTSVQDLYSHKQYALAATSLADLPDALKTSSSGERIQCRIDAELPDHRNPDTCAAPIRQRLSEPAPYLWKAYTAVASRNLALAEATALRSARNAKDPTAQQMLALVEYLQEKYTLVPKHLSENTTDTFTLTLLEGAALRSGNTKAFHALEQRIRSAKGPESGWQLYRDGLTAQQELNWNLALDDFRRCDADPDFIDPICAVSIANVELKQGARSAAKSDIDAALTHYSKNTSVLNEAIYIGLVTGDPEAAQQVHATLASKVSPSDANECLYFYGIDQPSLANPHCQAAINASDKSNVAWSNAGYVALDLGRYDTAMSDFAQAESLYEAANSAHTVTQELDLYWGLLLAGYMAGNKDDAKQLYLEIEKENPDFSSVVKLEQLPLVWSKSTLALMSKVTAELAGTSVAWNDQNPAPVPPK